MRPRYEPTILRIWRSECLLMLSTSFSSANSLKQKSKIWTPVRRIYETCLEWSILSTVACSELPIKARGSACFGRETLSEDLLHIGQKIK